MLITDKTSVESFFKALHKFSEVDNYYLSFSHDVLTLQFFDNSSLFTPRSIQQSTGSTAGYQVERASEFTKLFRELLSKTTSRIEFHPPIILRYLPKKGAEEAEMVLELGADRTQLELLERLTAVEFHTEALFSREHLQSLVLEEVKEEFHAVDLEGHLVNQKYIEKVLKMFHSDVVAEFSDSFVRFSEGENQLTLLAVRGV